MIRRAYPNELYHHGIKGQKWGVRRYQNPDGSLTAAGKERYRHYNVKDIKNELQKIADPNVSKTNYVTRSSTKSANDRMYRHITTAPNFTLGDSDRLYVYGDDDAASYAGLMAARQRMRNRKVYDVAIELKSSPRVAKRKDQEAILKETLDSLTDNEKRDLDNKIKSLLDSYGENNKKKISKQNYFDFLPYVEQNGRHDKAWLKYIEIAKNKGYDTLLDLNDERKNPNSAVFAIRPLILLDPDSQIMNYSVSELSDREIVNNLRKVLE